MKRTAMMLAMLGSMLVSCGLVDDCMGMPEGATCCDGTHFCEAGTTCNNSRGTCVSGGGGAAGTCSQSGADEYFGQKCHTTSGGIEFMGAAWPKRCGDCPTGITNPDGVDTVSDGGPYWLCVCN